MRAERGGTTQSRPAPRQRRVSAPILPNEIYTEIAAEIVSTIDRVAIRMIEQVREEYSDCPEYGSEVAADILDVRRDVHGLAARIVNKSMRDREGRIARVREVLGLKLNVSAAFLLEMVDDPDRPHGAAAECRANGYPRTTAVYAVHIRTALRPYDLETAVVTVRSRGYQISFSDAIRIRMLWGDLP